MATGVAALLGAAGLVGVSGAMAVGSAVTSAGAATGEAPSATTATTTTPTGGPTLGAGQVLAPGQTMASPDGQIVLTMQSDGNLVSYATVGGRPSVVWASGTSGNPGAQTVMQGDGNLVVYSAGGQALWASGTEGDPGAVVTVQNDGNTVIYGTDGAARWSTGTALGFVGPDEGPALASGQTLLSGEFLQSANGQYRLYQTPDGPPALYQRGNDGVWWVMEGADTVDSVPGLPTVVTCALCTDADPVADGSFLALQADGNLVLYPPGGGPAEWSSGTAGVNGVRLQLQDDGNLVLYGVTASGAQGPGTQGLGTQGPGGQVSARWQTGTEMFRGTVLGEGVTLQPGQFVASPDGLFELVMQDDGNLVLYDAGRSRALWSSRTNGDGGAFVTMQADGNLVVYEPDGSTADGAEVTPADEPDGSGVSVRPVWGSGLPPEVNSGLLYAGPGGGPLLAAAGAWTALAAELDEATAAYDSVIGQLSAGEWRGPANSTLAAVAAYTAWLSTTTAQADRAAGQAEADAAAFEAAFAATVPPPLVATNRVQLASLVATNLFGQSAPAISVAEAEYEQMWAQDAAAMYGYGGASTTAFLVPPVELDYVADPGSGS